MKRALLPILFAFMLLPTAKADHFIGSDFTWECLGNDTFKIILTFYQDCNGCHFGERQTGCTWELCGLPALSITSNCGTKSATFTQLYHEDITPVCDEQCTRCTKCDCSFQFGIRKHVLVATVYVGDHRKNGCCEFTISYRSCCRSTAITTGAANAGFYVDAQFNACQTPCDNSPKFTNAPIAILCLGRDFIYNQGATDTDIDTVSGGLADSLVYSFGTPMASASQKTTWSGSYDYDKPLYYLGFPKKNLKFPRGFFLDTFTGDMMFRPMKQEITVLAIKIEQYRNGKKISETRRDIQIIVIKCPDNEPPVISGINCSKPTPQNFKANACAGETICFTVCSSDKDKDDTVTINWNAGIPGASFRILNKGDKRENGQFCWTPTEAQVSKFPYNFVVTAKDDACPVNGYTARSYQIVVKEAPKAAYDTLVYDCGNAEFSVRKTGKINIAQYMWVLNGNVKVRTGADKDTVTTKFKYPGKKPFALTLIGKNGCNKTYVDTITIPKFVNVTITKDTSVCAGSTINLTSSVSDSSGNVNFEWSNGEKVKRYTSITVGNKDTFVVAYVKDDQCDNSDTCFIRVNRPPNFDLGAAVRICPSDIYKIKPTEIVDSIDGGDTVFTYKWYQGSLNNFVVQSDSFLASDSAMYYAIGTDSLKCTSTDSVMVFVNPERDWLPSDEIICSGDTAFFEVKENTPVSTFNWYASPTDTLNSVATGADYFDLPKSDKWYGIKWEEKIGGVTCYAYDSFSVKVNPLPIITFSQNSAELCENYGEFSLDLIGQPYDGTWFDTSETRNYVRNNKLYTDEAGADGTNPLRHMLGYTFTDKQTGCIDTAYWTVLIKPLPEVELNADTLFVCNSEYERELGQYVDKVKSKGKWKGPGVVLESGKYFFRILEVGLLPADYQLIYEYTNSTGNQPWCTNYDTLTVRVIEVPTVEAGVYDSLCLDANEISFDKATPLGSTGIWYYNGKNGVLRDKKDGTFNPSDYGEGKHYFTYVYTVRRSVCADSAQTSITVNPLPQPQINTNWDLINGENRICFNESSKALNGNIQDANSVFTSTIWDGRGVNVNQFEPKTAGLGQHTLTYSVINIFGCGANVQEDVQVDDVKEVEFTNAVVCLGDTIRLDAITKNADLVNWGTDGDGVFLDVTDKTARYIPQGKDLSNVFKITATTNNSNNICPEVDFTNELEVHPIPNISFVQSDTIGCAPLEVTYSNQTNISRGTISSVIWSFGNDKSTTSKDSGSIVKTVYGVIGSTDRFIGKLVAKSDKGCKDSVKFTVFTLLRPRAAYVPKPAVTTIINPSVFFENKTEYIINDDHYSWYFDDPTVGGGTSTAKDAYYTYTEVGEYNVVLYAENVHEHDGVTISCLDSSVQLITVNPEVLVYIPNVFTPDNEGPELNNYFKPVVTDASAYGVKVFNRWGEKMWESEDPNESWDGTFKGVDCEAGVYLYVLRVENHANKEYEFSGTVTLIR